MFRYLLSFVLLVIVSAGTNQEGLDFLAKMKQEEGVIETPSGLLYKVGSPCKKGFLVLAVTRIYY